MHRYRPHKAPKINYTPNNSFIKQGTSREELDLHKTINLILPGVETVKGDRTILEGREIDIYIPQFRTGIEYDGLAFHSDIKDPNYHQWKTLLAEKKKVRLIHIWSDLWNTKRGIVTDYLSKMFGKYQSISYKECILTEISKQEAKKFLDSTHIQGYNKEANKFFGYFYKNYLISVTVFKEKNNSWTFLQKSDRSTLMVEEDLKHIIEYIEEKYKPLEILATIDRSLFDGEDLKTLGFRVESLSKPNINWTKDFKTRKLQEKYTLEQMKEAGYHSFYDCGTLTLRKSLPINFT